MAGNFTEEILQRINMKYHYLSWYESKADSVRLCVSVRAVNDLSEQVILNKNYNNFLQLWTTFPLMPSGSDLEQTVSFEGQWEGVVIPEERDALWDWVLLPRCSNYRSISVWVQKHSLNHLDFFNWMYIHIYAFIQRDKQKQFIK